MADTNVVYLNAQKKQFTKKSAGYPTKLEFLLMAKYILLKDEMKKQ